MTDRRLPLSKIQALGVDELVEERLNQGRTYDQVVKEIQELTGEDISLSAVWRWNNRLRRAAERMRRVEELAHRVVEEAQSRDLDLARFAGDLLLPKIIEAVADMPDDEIAGLPPEKIALMIKRLSDAGVSRGRLRHQFDKGVAAAREAILAELERELGADSDLLGQLRERAEAAAARVEEAA